MDDYLLDIDICIFYLKNKFSLKEKIRAIGISNCYLSEITLYELTYGAYKSSNVEKHLEEIADLKLLFTILPALESRFEYGSERIRLEREGNRIPDFDLLIGASAVTYSMTMVTNNEAHMSRIMGIKNGELE